MKEAVTVFLMRKNEEGLYEEVSATSVPRDQAQGHVRRWRAAPIVINVSGEDVTTKKSDGDSLTCLE